MTAMASSTTNGATTTATPTMEELLHAPALAPPDGVTPVMSTWSPDQAGLYAIAVLAGLIPGVLLAIRMYTKIRIVRRVDVTDYLTILAYLNLVAMLAVSRYILLSGGGAHQWNITVEQLQGVVHWMWLAEILYGPAISLIKTVILLQYQRIFAPRRSIDPFLFITSWIIIVLVCLWNFVSTWISIFACNPREKFWNKLITDGSCLDFNTDIQLTSLFNIIVDVVILILPTRATWKLSIPVRRKLAISSVFAIGLLACIANGMIILYSVRQTGDGADESYNITWMGAWAIIEIALGLVVICALSLPRFVESKGKKIRFFFVSIVRSSTSLGSRKPWKSWKSLARSTVDTELADVETGTDIRPWDPNVTRASQDFPPPVPPKIYVQTGTEVVWSENQHPPPARRLDCTPAAWHVT